MNDLVLKSFNRLKQYCEEEEFKGWDPYDGLNSSIFQSLTLFSRKRFPRLIWIQLIKKLPVNLRPIFKIGKDYNPKGLALFLSGYSKLSSIEDFKVNSIERINGLATKLISLRTIGFSGSCWGYNFDWESKAFFQPRFTPTIVVSTYAANALIDAYEITGNKNFLETAIQTKGFIINDLKRTYLKNGNFAFSYSPIDQTSVFNASLMGARLLSRIYSYTKEAELFELSKKAVAYCCDFQNRDGSWYYSTLPFHQWIDSFHTGFNLECISDYAQYTNDSTFDTQYQKGMEYYLNTFFDSKGRSKYYNNSLYPIDLHSTAQLIITLNKTNLLNRNMKLVNLVLKWTIEKMQSSKGYFYFQKHRLYTNKIPYMRWPQAWMFYAMAHYLQSNNFNSYENLV